jgi:AcrR family transcriptional regulator
MPKTGLTPEELYQKALDVAEAEIRRNGVERLRITDVARDLRISHAAVYKHFLHKEALIDAVSQRWLDRIDAVLAEIAVRDLSAETRLIEWFVTLHSMKREKVLADPQLFSAFNMAAEKTRPFVMHHLKTMFEQLESIINSAIEQGEFKCKDAHSAAEILFEGTMAFHHPRLVLETMAMERSVMLKRVLTTLLNGLKVG